MIQQGLQAQVINVRTHRGTKFLNKTLQTYFKEEGISHQTTIARTPEQNSVVERRNRILVEAARTMLSASKLPLFFWAKAITSACVSKSSALSDNLQQQDTQSTLNVQPILESIIPPTYVNAEENNTDQAKDAEFEAYEFNNPFAHQEQKLMSCSCNINTYNMHTFYQRHYPEMCMFALTVSKAEPKNIKEAIVDHAWIEAIQEDLHQFDRLNG
ncbi:retrovirus-related pol polyprotein from transposon TNT 1-94 [Tanacetum coccineum]